MIDREAAWREYQTRRFLRPDWERFARPDAANLRGPVPYTAVLSPARADANVASITAVELAAAYREHAALREMVEDLKRASGTALPALKFSPNQPRVPAGSSDGGRWTAGDGSTGSDDAAKPTPAYLAPAIPAVAQGIRAALTFFAWLSGGNTADRQAVLEFNAREFQRLDADPAGAMQVRTLDRDEVREVCPRLPEVQERTNVAAAAIQRDGMSPSRYGTAVHTDIKKQLDALDDPNFRAEVSFLKQQTEVSYGEKGSIRVDVYENVKDNTVCVYDIKTGRSEFTLSRMQEIGSHVFARDPFTQRIILTEIRPRR